jgi:electron transport complex protein RnfC
VEQSRCIRCGKCIDACPMHLMPVLIYKASQTGSVDEMMAVNLMDCIECGCCAYTCPASVPPSRWFVTQPPRPRNKEVEKLWHR